MHSPYHLKMKNPLEAYAQKYTQYIFMYNNGALHSTLNQ